MTIKEFLAACRAAYPRVDLRYAHPSLYVLCVSEDFASVDKEARVLDFLEKIDSSGDELERLESVAGVVIELCTPAERALDFAFLDDDDGTSHWLPLQDKTTREALVQPPVESIPAIHFYGFKGGQARSTVLAMLAKSLAVDDYRVLLVDADVEAPSLDLLFDVIAADNSSTLMGLCGWSDEIVPIPASGSPLSRGVVDVIPCRPRSDNFDMDFAAFTVRVALDSGTLSHAINRLKAYLKGLPTDRQYDVVIFDHRTGIAPSVLPLMHDWRGPVVIAARPDGLSAQAHTAFASLFAQNPENPGAFISFSLDPDDSRGAIFQRSGKEVQSLLSQLSSAIAKGAEEPTDEERLPPDAMLQYWVSWFVDRALFGDVSPPLERLSSDNRRAISQLREVLGFEKLPQPNTNVAPQTATRVRSPSGALDTGWFIETPEISKLLLPHSSVNYVVGRKGTGKTRLYKEMVERGLAEPIFAAADFKSRGIKSQSTVQAELLSACGNDFSRFWWALLAVSLATAADATSEQFDEAIRSWCALGIDERQEQATSHSVARLAGQSRARRYLLIDGVETAVSSSRLKEFIEQLLLFMLTVQSDSKLSGAVFVRLFLRTDLLRNATQNIEQQTSQRKLELRWDSDGIFNFALARIEQTDWFNENFAAACDLIRAEKERIKAGRLSRTEYTAILLSIFPKKLRRNNIQTITFFDTYFSDAGGDSQDGASFYPRLFENFLHQITVVAQARAEKKLPSIDQGRVMHGVVLEAHAAASAAFINEVTSELYALLQLDTDDQKNKSSVESLVAALEGQTTPFPVATMVKSIQDSMPGIESSKIRDALQRMREVGIFEGRPDYPGEWRAGRLYKSALRMKYVR
nr:AAA family ATPase [uncultured Aquabacterium sp.]